MAYEENGVGWTCGKCDHFTIEQEGREQDCYVTTEFYRCNSLYPVRSFIATRTGEEEQILLILPEISKRSRFYARGRRILSSLSIGCVIGAGLSSVRLALTGAPEWWFFVLFWAAVSIVVFSAICLGCYKHQASEEDKEKYIQLMTEAATLRDVLEQIQNPSTEWGPPPSGSEGAIDHPPPYSEVSPLNYGSYNGPVLGYGGLGSTVRTQPDTTRQINEA